MWQPLQSFQLGTYEKLRSILRANNCSQFYPLFLFFNSSTPNSTNYGPAGAHTVLKVWHRWGEFIFWPKFFWGAWSFLLWKMDFSHLTPLMAWDLHYQRRWPIPNHDFSSYGVSSNSVEPSLSGVLTMPNNNFSNYDPCLSWYCIFVKSVHWTHMAAWIFLIV